MSKTALLGSVALLTIAFAGTASAQSTTSPQLGAGFISNEAIVVQRGGSNSANVDQTAASNGKVGSLNSTVDLTASYMSTGYGNAQFEYANSVLQSGDANSLSITQGGTNDSIATANSNYSRGNFSFDPGSNGSFQKGYGNGMTVTQNGYNSVVQFQQNGDNNRGTATVDNGASSTYAGIFQFGNSNEASVHQGYGASNAYAVVVQGGSSNRGYIDQNGYVNYAALLQLGDANYGNIVQSGNSGIGAFGYQNGYGNSGTVVQTGGSPSNAMFAQAGNNNIVTIRQK